MEKGCPHIRDKSECQHSVTYIWGSFITTREMVLDKKKNNNKKKEEKLAKV